MVISYSQNGNIPGALLFLAVLGSWNLPEKAAEAEGRTVFGGLFSLVLKQEENHYRMFDRFDGYNWCTWWRTPRIGSNLGKPVHH